MSRFTLLLAVAFSSASISVSAQHLLVSLRKDSARLHYFDSNSGAEQFSNFSYYSYNAENLPVTELYITKSGNSTTYYRYDNNYNAQNLLQGYVEYQSTVSINGPWTNFLKEDYTYDQQDRIIFFIGQFGNANGDWENYFRENTWFDDNVPASDSSLYELWSSANTAWGNYRRSFNYYYPDGKIRKSNEEEWVAATSSWRDLNENEYTYYPDGKLLTQKATSFFSITSRLEKLDSFIYLADGKVDTIYSFSTSLPGGVTNQLYTKYKYDAFGNLLETESFLKGISTGLWRRNSRYTYLPADGIYSDEFSYELSEIFDQGIQAYKPVRETTRHFTDLGNGQVLYVEVNKQNGTNGLGLQSIDSVWYKKPLVGTHAPAQAAHIDCGFPNPFSAGDCIVCQSSDRNSMLLLRLLNASGQLVAQARALPGESWYPAGNLPAGMYFLSVWQNGKYLGERKMIVR